MPRKFFKKLSPDPHKIRKHRIVNLFGELLHDPNLWHLNRRSVAGALGIGCFFMWIPVPIQMYLAAATAIWLRTNLPLSVATVWITNPVTIPPVFYFCYLVGTWMLNTPPSEFEFELTFEWLSSELVRFWQPLLLGCFIVASSSALAGFLFIRLVWRYHIIQHIKERKLRKKSTSSNDV